MWKTFILLIKVTNLNAILYRSIPDEGSYVVSIYEISQVAKLRAYDFSDKK